MRLERSSIYQCQTLKSDTGFSDFDAKMSSQCQLPVLHLCSKEGIKIVVENESLVSGVTNSYVSLFC